jgi:hypothetical protein
MGAQMDPEAARDAESVAARTYVCTVCGGKETRPAPLQMQGAGCLARSGAPNGCPGIMQRLIGGPEDGAT